MKLNKTLLITDADGTLLTDNKRILDCDKAAICELQAAGGLFTVATGRGVSLARTVVNELGADLLKIPAIIFNGAAIYDYSREEFLYKCSLCENARNYFKTILAQFPEIGVEILIDDEIYVANTNDYEEKHLALGNITPVRCKINAVPQDEWIKVLLVDEPHLIDKTVEFVKANPCEFAHVVRSAPMFLEILPQGVNKGTGVAKLLEILGLSDYYTVAAGDYMNDLEMLEQADLGVAVANAEECVKQAADLTVCDNNSGVVREIVKELNRNFP
jgi:Cof subfamily protein (haloacid dehalogenase superfamily)